MGERELACRIDALGSVQRARHRTLLAELIAAAEAVEELPDGYAIRFPARPYLFLRLAEWVELERACCPFLSIRLEFDREAARGLRLDIPAGSSVRWGPGEVKEIGLVRYGDADEHSS